MGFGRNGGTQQQGIFSVQGVSENKKAGFRFDLRFRFNASDGVGTAMDSWGGVWFEPAPIFRVDAGRFNITTLRGKVGSGWLKTYTAPAKGETEIFGSFDGRDAVLFTLKPVEGLWVGAMVNNMVDLANTARESNYLTSGNQDNWGLPPSTPIPPLTGFGDTYAAGNALLKYALEDIQIGLGYTITDIGLVRAQYVGAHPTVTFTTTGVAGTAFPSPTFGNAASINAQRIEAAFALTAVENLTLDLGVKYWFAVKDFYPTLSVINPTTGAGVKSTPSIPNIGQPDQATKVEDTYQKPIQASLGAVYKLDPITINGRIDSYFGAYYENKTSGKKVEMGPEVWVYLWPTYAISEELIAGLDVGLVYTGENKYDGTVTTTGGLRYGFGASIRYNIAPGAYIRAGLAYGGGTINQGSKDDAKKLNSVFTIPVGFEVSF
jgi:hypothetical protein